MKSKHFLLILVLLAIAGTALSQPPRPPREPFSINNFTDDLTLLIIRVDSGRITPAPIPVPGGNDHPDLFALFADVQRPLEPFLAKLRAAGVAEFYLIVNLVDLGPGSMFFLAAPDRPGSNLDDVKALLAGAAKEHKLVRGFAVSRLRGALLAGSPNVLERVRGTPGGTGADWEARFEEMRPGLLQVQFRPYDGWQRVVEELMPTLPHSVGGGPSTAITRGLKSASLSLDVPPQPALHLEAQSESAADAKAMLGVLVAGMETLGSHKEIRKAFPDQANVITTLTPGIEGNSLVLSLDGQGIRALVEGPLGASVNSAKGQAQPVQSMQNLKQIGLGFHLYASEHEGATPGHLADIVTYLGSQPPIHHAKRQALPAGFADWPRKDRRAWMDEHAGYTYVAPGTLLKEISAPSRTVIAYEKAATQSDGGPVNALFADGHVERLASRDALEALSGTRP